MAASEEKHTSGSGPGRPTSRDVARLAGVSHTAVSFVFNGRAEGNLSLATQERIREAAAQLGYRPDPVARGLRSRRTAVIGLVTDEIASTPFAGRLLRGAMETAWDSEHLVLTIDSGGDPAKEDAAVAELLDRRVDGIIYAAMSLRRVRVPEGLHRTHSVLANCLPEDGSLSAVIPAERAGGRAAARLLLAQGHRRVAVVGGEADIASVERLQGFRDALRTEGVTVPREWVVRTGGEISSGYEGALRLLDGAAAGRCPTGLFCYNDRVAAGALHAAARLGLSVPGDLSVIGYDDQEHMAAFLSPPLTTVALPHRAMGEAAVRLVLGAIGAGRVPRPAVRRIACPVIDRESVGPAPRR
ncbi:LacI family DNA-binding transcriptional regulator [Streptomyces smyrnaeus]|uniref:LacI family DNA-binding transcriptional regulator n=1 Tax=Streptomyces TaxID=1883 RepID=UPI000C1A35F4|nr:MULTISPECIES: LacI family DNA-binding transcriptional regulator [unclassified Streptomyces]MBQ0866919.1 LacI family DNA-binding transcriptional regulator [Streptomyces sp. RK75]MBQ1124907.1 LacI family DNA-binding transcriptional regulator [Streptomyces sp. B15]MBQ1160840.1 LacI family DNA-binding transcriptional regulator [Streptomyces sp. A73]